MPRKDQAGKKNVVKKKLTQGEKNKIKQANKAKANPAKAAKKKEKNNSKRAGRYVLSTPFSFSSFFFFHFFASPDNGTTTLTLFYFDPVVFTPRSSCRCRLRFLPTVLHLVPPNLCNCLRCVRQRDSSIVGVLNERKKEINHNRKDVILNRRVQMQKIAFTMYNGLL